jgi:AcrR family transcriptional regulator
MYEFFEDREHLVTTIADEASARLARGLRYATRGDQDPVERLVRLGLAYIRFAKRHPADFILLYGRLSRRRSLAEDAPADSEYSHIHTVVVETIGAERLGDIDPRLLEALAYGFWSVIHGMAMLQLTHLDGFKADFETAHRVVLESIADSWRRRDWEGALAVIAESPRVRRKTHDRE